MQIKDRIIDFRRVPAQELLENPNNWRVHGYTQKETMKDAFEEIGFADAVIAWESPEGLMLIDGHLRKDLAPDMEIPVLVTDLNQEEADKLIMSYDPLSAMAGIDSSTLQALIDKAAFDSETLNNMIRNVAESVTVPHVIPSTYYDEFRELTDEEIQRRQEEMEGHFANYVTEIEEGHIDLACPNCGHDFQMDRATLMSQTREANKLRQEQQNGS